MREYVIKAKYLNKAWETIDTAATREEAECLVGEYRLAFGTGWRFSIKLA